MNLLECPAKKQLPATVDSLPKQATLADPGDIGVSVGGAARQGGGAQQTPSLCSPGPERSPLTGGGEATASKEVSKEGGERKDKGNMPKVDTVDGERGGITSVVPRIGDNKNGGSRGGEGGEEECVCVEKGNMGDVVGNGGRAAGE